MGILEFLYYTGYRLKTAYDLSRRKKLSVRVISMGNLTTGGTGKTPAAISLAREARLRGRRPCILTRGYRGRAKGPVVVTPDKDAALVGDEPLLMARLLGDIPVVKGADRYASAMHALNTVSPTPDLFILDDGFQHRRLHRDLDILLMNARNPFGNMKLLPAGSLREPVDRMQRADVIVITKSGEDDTEKLEEQIKKYGPNAHVFFSRHVPTSVKLVAGGDYPIEWLSGRAVYAFSGIAEPGHFISILKNAGAKIAGSRAFRDHHAFTRRDIEKIEDEAGKIGVDWIITTEKDIMRLKDLALPGNLLALGIEFTVDEGFYDLVVNVEKLGA
jgi:tetraacyldisaccharide 4'-kinase